MTPTLSASTLSPQLRQKRAQDRRDSPRVPLRLWVRFPNEGGSFEECEGNVGLSGVFWLGPVKPTASEVEIAFWLPYSGEEIRAKGNIVRSTQVGARIGVHVKLGDLDVRTELALARFLQDWAHNA